MYELTERGCVEIERERERGLSKNRVEFSIGSQLLLISQTSSRVYGEICVLEGRLNIAPWVGTVKVSMGV